MLCHQHPWHCVPHGSFVPQQRQQSREEAGERRFLPTSPHCWPQKGPLCVCAALAPSHHPSSSSAITVGHPQACPLPGPAPGCVWVSQRGRTDRRMKRSCCPIAVTSIYPGKRKTGMVSITAGRGTMQLMLSPMSQDKKTCVGNLSMVKMKP